MTIKPTTTEAPPAVSRQVAIEQMNAGFEAGIASPTMGPQTGLLSPFATQTSPAQAEFAQQVSDARNPEAPPPPEGGGGETTLGTRGDTPDLTTAQPRDMTKDVARDNKK